MEARPLFHRCLQALRYIYIVYPAFHMDSLRALLFVAKKLQSVGGRWNQCAVKIKEVDYHPILISLLV